MPLKNLALALVAAASLVLPACGGGGGGGGGTGALKLSITDAPFPATDGCVSAALVTIDGVRVRSASEGGWTDLVLADVAGLGPLPGLVVGLGGGFQPEGETEVVDPLREAGGAVGDAGSGRETIGVRHGVSLLLLPFRVGRGRTSTRRW